MRSGRILAAVDIVLGWFHAGANAGRHRQAGGDAGICTVLGEASESISLKTCEK